MKLNKRKTPSQNMRRASQKQVREYVERYHPEAGQVSVAINATGTVASVRPRVFTDNHGQKQPFPASEGT
jgi:hypothetical protein